MRGRRVARAGEALYARAAECAHTCSELRCTAKYMRCDMLPQMHEEIREKIVKDARQRLEKARLGQVKIALDYEAFLSALAVGQCPNCQTDLQVVEAAESDNGFRYKYACGHGWQGIMLRESLKVHESFKLKSKKPGFGLVVKMFQGYKASGDPKLPEGVEVRMVVDREKNEYHQIVKDNLTGLVLHEEHELLTEHKSKPPRQRDLP